MGLRRRTLSRSWNRDKPSKRFAASVIRSSVARSRSGALKAGFAVFRTRTSWDETTWVMWRPAHALRCRNLPSERPFDGLERKGGTSPIDHRGPSPDYELRHDAAGERWQSTWPKYLKSLFNNLNQDNGHDPAPRNRNDGTASPLSPWRHVPRNMSVPSSSIRPAPRTFAVLRTNYCKMFQSLV